ncbi:MAG: DUF4271 domain-containing protein [Chitinophagaceae bacterium]|nr:DUF4271 domain-containing protein [Chitinophagaceae bacterium]
MRRFFLIASILCFSTSLFCNAQLKKDTLSAAIPIHQDTIKYLNGKNRWDDFILHNTLINHSTAEPVTEYKINHKKKEVLFYLLCSIVLLMGLLKIFYTRYFNNIFRVFFNSSLRQNQLTDQLLQARLPSLIFNLFFIITGGLYAWLILNNSVTFKNTNNYFILFLCITILAVIYTGKFISLKFIGWLTGLKMPSDTYIFVIFLINKIEGIILLPVVILLAFASPVWVNIISIVSFCILGLLFLLRYVRSYSLLQHQFKFDRFHFLLYILALEIIPIAIICKYLSKFIT